MKHRFAPTKSWTVPRFHVTVTYRSSHFHLGAIVFNTREAASHSQKCCDAPVLSTSVTVLSAYLIATYQPQPFWASTKRLLQRMARSGEVPGVQIGDLWRFRASIPQRLARLKTRRVVPNQPRLHPQLKLCCPKPLVPVSTKGATPLLTRTRYQFGSLRLKQRRNGSQAWEFRYYVDQLDGGRKRQHVTIGTCQRYPTGSPRSKSRSSPLLLNLNAEAPRAELEVPSFGTLLDKYAEEEMPARYSTRKSYESNIKTHIRPKWADYPLDRIKPMPVEQWLQGTQAGSRNPRRTSEV